MRLATPPIPGGFGGIAAQRAASAALEVAALAGARVDLRPFHPVIHRVLLGGVDPLYLSADITGGDGSAKVSDTPTWSLATKVAARYLAPYPEVLVRLAGRAV